AATSSVVRAGLEALVQASSALTLIGSAPGAASAAFSRQLDELRPDAALVELDSRDEAALDALLAHAVVARPPALVALVDDPQDSWVVEALRAGVRAILTRASSAEEIVAAVEAAAAGLVVLEPAVIESLTAHTSLVPRGELDAPLEALTP